MVTILQSVMIWSRAVTISISSLLEGSSLVIWSTEFFYSTNSSILMTIPDNYLMEHCNQDFIAWARFWKIYINNCSRSWNWLNYLAKMMLYISSVWTLNKPKSAYLTSWDLICCSTYLEYVRHKVNTFYYIFNDGFRRMEKSLFSSLHTNVITGVNSILNFSSL